MLKFNKFKSETAVEGYVGSTGKDTDLGHLAARHYQHTIYSPGQRHFDYHDGKKHVAAIKSIEGKIKQHHGADAVKAVRKHSKQADSYDGGKGNNSFHKSFAQKHLGGAGSDSHKKYMAGLPKSATHPYLNKESVEQVDEAFTVAQRIKAKQRMKKMSKRIQMAKKRAMKRAPSTEKLKLRARKQAKGALVAKWSKGKQKGELSFAQRQNIEKRLKSASGRIDTMSKKLLPDVRKQDRERRSNAKNKSEEK